MKETFRTTIPVPDPAFQQLEDSGSIQATTENLEEVSEKIAKMMPDIGIIGSTGLLKNTESFKESKQIVDTFVKSIKNLPENAFEETPQPQVEEKDTRSPLEKATDTLDQVVSFMIKAGIKVPSIYKDFLYSVRPPQYTSKTIDIQKKKPLFSIEGIDENGEVKLVTNTDIEIKQGKKKIRLREEKLRKTIEDSRKVDTKNVLEMKDWIACKVKEAGSLEKINDNDWRKFREIMNDKLNKKDELDLGEFMKELKQEDAQYIPDPNVKAPPYQYLTEGLGPVNKEKEIYQTVNKNAYEIRLEILKQAIELAKLQNECGPPSSNDIIEMAIKLYRFVENKR